jgi:DNA-binding NarL/FixJ family response regulator
MKIRTVLADHHQLFRHAVRALLAEFEDIEVVGETSDGKDLRQLVAESNAQIVCINVAAPGMDAAATTRLLVESNPGVGVIGLSELTDWPSVRDLLKAGARGYLSKDIEVQELVRAIRTVARSNQKYFCQCATASITSALLHQAEASTPTETPRGREREIVRLIANGQTTPEIAQLLRLSQGTVRGYRSSIMQSLNLHSRTELTRYAIRKGITTGFAALAA